MTALDIAAAVRAGERSAREVLDEHLAVGVLDDARAGGGFRCGGALPLVAAGDAFPFRGMLQHIGHLTHRAGRFAHKKIQPNAAWFQDSIIRLDEMLSGLRFRAGPFSSASTLDFGLRSLDSETSCRLKVESCWLAKLAAFNLQLSTGH